MHRGTDIIQDRHDAWRTLGFYHLTHHLVVEVLYGLPLDAFLYILLLVKTMSVQCAVGAERWGSRSGQATVQKAG